MRRIVVVVVVVVVRLVTSVHGVPRYGTITGTTPAPVSHGTLFCHFMFIICPSFAASGRLCLGKSVLIKTGIFWASFILFHPMSLESCNP